MTKQEQTYKQIVERVAQEVGLPVDVVDKTYRAFWLGVRHYLTELPLSEELTEEQYSKLRTSVNIPSLGKFSCDYERYTRMKKRLEYIKKIREDDSNKEN